MALAIRRRLARWAGSSEQSVLEGLQAQLDRVSHFEDSIDPGRALETYRRVLDLLWPNLEDLRVQAGLTPRPVPFSAKRARIQLPLRYRHMPVPTDRVFTYWDRPIDQAPPLVQACLAQLQSVYPHVHVLNGETVRDFIDVPQRIADLLEHDRPAHFTDYVRTKLLEQHGGIWVDATAWVDRDLTAVLKPKLRSGTFFVRWTRTQISNWFIASQPGTPMITLLRLALELWWQNNDDLPDYFLYHRIFDVLRATVPEFRGQWAATPGYSSAAAHLMQLEMMMAYRPHVLEAILATAPLQKLSYKYDTVPEGSLLEHLIRNYQGRPDNRAALDAQRP